MPQPKIATKVHHVAVRLDDETLTRLEDLRPCFSLPGRMGTMSDVLRAVILSGLEVEEAKPPKGGG
jgi:hypothetical protein